MYPTMRQIAQLPVSGHTAISLFSGCGGSSLGYRMAGIRVVWANEFIPSAAETYRANFPDTLIDMRDIRRVEPQDILDDLALLPGELDILDGSPPCSPFSTAGKRARHWGTARAYSETAQRTDDLFFEYARIVAGLRPRVFIAENVSGLTVGVAKGLLGSPQTDLLDSQAGTIFHTLSNIGYRVAFRVLNAAHYGVPQNRRRCIFVGVREDLGVAPSFPKPSPHRISIRDAIPWIADPAEIGGGPFPVEPETDISRFAIGQEWDKLGVGQQSDRYFSLVRPALDAPCPTITQLGWKRGVACVVHPLQKRKFSIAELKRLCGFPDDFVLTGTYAQQYERLGRAVPPPMMARIAAHVREQILERGTNADS